MVSMRTASLGSAMPRSRRAVERRAVPLVALPAQQQRHPEHAGEHDELLAERVEAANIEVDGGDGVGDLALRDGDRG